MARKEEARMDEPFQQSFGRIVVEPARRRLVIDGEPAKIRRARSTCSWR